VKIILQIKSIENKIYPSVVAIAESNAEREQTLEWEYFGEKFHISEGVRQICGLRSNADMLQA
jgi:hypothetical protein